MKKQLTLSVFVLLASVGMLAQAPVFRSETTVVQMPLRVLDAKGSFVRDLTAADIEVLEDGVPQAITDFNLVDLTESAKRPPQLAAATGVLPAADLEKVDGRLYVFLLDDAHTGVGYSARARELMREFVRTRMAPRDAAAVVIASGAARQDFTHDKQALLKAIDRFTGTLDASVPAVVRESQARAIVKLVTDLAAALAKIRGRHKALIYVGTRMGCQVSMEASQDFFPALRGQQSEPQARTGDQVGNPSANVTEAPSDAAEQILCNEQLFDTVRAAVQANVTLYAIDPRGMQTRGFINPEIDGRGGPDAARRRMAAIETGRPSVLDGFYVLSDHTGGFAVTGTNNFRDPFDRIVRESGTYYLLAYTSTNSRADGKYRRTQINIKRQGVQSFYRAGYIAQR